MIFKVFLKNTFFSQIPVKTYLTLMMEPPQWNPFLLFGLSYPIWANQVYCRFLFKIPISFLSANIFTFYLIDFRRSSSKNTIKCIYSTLWRFWKSFSTSWYFRFCCWGRSCCWCRWTTANPRLDIQSLRNALAVLQESTCLNGDGNGLQQLHNTVQKNLN